MTSELAVVMAVVALVWRQAALVLVEACLACTSSHQLHLPSAKLDERTCISSV